MTNKTTTQETGFFNANDWSGEEINVAYTITETGVINFAMNGYTFEIGNLHTDDGLKDGDGYRVMYGSDWEDSLTTLFFCDQDGADHKAAVIKAATYVRNFV